LFAAAADIARFGLMHVSSDATLRADAVAEMQRPRVVLPSYGGAEPTHHGLGWKIYDWPRGRLLGHNGNGTGQVAFVRVAPRARVAVAMMTNTLPSGTAAWRDVSSALWTTLDVEPAPVLTAHSASTDDGDRYAGTYEMRGASFEIATVDDGLRMKMRIFEDEPVTAYILQVDDARFVTRSGVAVVFEQVGESLLLHYGPLVARRSSPT
jgi:CubicO group peptidase (beta-lactamase class C family)